MDEITEFDIEKIYSDMEEYLIKNIKRNLTNDLKSFHLKEEKDYGFNWEAWQSAKLKDLQKFRKQNKDIVNERTKGIDKKIAVVLNKEARQGKLSAYKGYKEALTHGYKSSVTVKDNFFKMNSKKVRSLINSVTNDFQKVNYATFRKSNDIYRQIIAEASVYNNTGVMTPKQAIRKAINDFEARGINSIVYANGSRHKISEYTSMAIRTASTRAQLMGEGELRKKLGVTTIQMSKHSTACKLCQPWEGRVLIDDVYSGGSKKDGKYPLLSEAMKQGLYHPNCRHGHGTFFPELSKATNQRIIDKVEKEEIVKNVNKDVKKSNKITDVNAELKENTNNGRIFVEKLLEKYKGSNKKFVKAFENANLDDASKKIINNIEKIDDVEVKTGKKSYFKPVINELSIKGNLNGTVYHEWGHSIDYLVSKKINKDNNFEWISNSLENIRNATKLKNKNSIPDNLINIFGKQRERLKAIFKEDVAR